MQSKDDYIEQLHSERDGFKFAAESHLKTIKTQQDIIAGYLAREQAKPTDLLASGFVRAVEVRASQGWKLGMGPVPILYTDTVNGDQVCRDDVWLCKTEHLSDAARGVPTRELMDAARLDWLDGDDFVALNCYVAVYDENGQPLEKERKHYLIERESTIATFEAPTVREAIDAARHLTAPHGESDKTAVEV
jgi:hypothetical protein